MSLHGSRRNYEGGQMTKVQIPVTIETAIEELEGLAALLTARGWERAAIIYAFTYDGRQSLELKNREGRMTVSEFIELGITDLSSDASVALNRKRWIEHGDPDIKPGDMVTLPKVKWPPIESRPNKHRVSKMKAEALAGHIAARDDAEEVIERFAEENLEAAITGTGKALRKKNTRAKKEQDADIQKERKPGQKKRHTDRGLSDSLIRLHAAKSELHWYRTYLDNNPDLSQSDEERGLIRDALIDIDTDVMAIRMVVDDVLEQMEAT